MNSDESDWDSMSEAPPIPNNQLENTTTKYPPPAPTTQDTRNRINSQQHLSRSSRPAPTQGQEDSPAQQPHQGRHGKEREVQGGRKEKVKNLKGSDNQEEIRGRAKLPVPAKRSPSSKDSGIDTGTVCSSNMTPATVREADINIMETCQIKGDVLEVGFVNKGFDDTSEDSTNENNLANLNFKPYPDPEERISLLQFEEIKTKYFQIEFENEGLLVDKAIPCIVSFCTKVSAEILGLLKIPLVLVFVIVGQVLRVLTTSILRPFSDFIFKPLLVSLHNLLLSPLFSLLYNISSMVATTISPCCSATRYSPLWSYSEHKENNLPV